MPHPHLNRWIDLVQRTLDQTTDNDDYIDTVLGLLDDCLTPSHFRDFVRRRSNLTYSDEELEELSDQLSDWLNQRIQNDCDDGAEDDVRSVATHIREVCDEDPTN